MLELHEQGLIDVPKLSHYYIPAYYTLEQRAEAIVDLITITAIISKETGTNILEDISFRYSF